MNVGIKILQYDEVVYDIKTKECSLIKSHFNNKKYRKINATIIREMIKNKKIEKNYLINDIIFKTLSKELTNQKELLIKK